MAAEFREIRSRLLIQQSYSRTLEQIIDRLVRKFVPLELQQNTAALEVALFDNQSEEISK